MVLCFPIKSQAVVTNSSYSVKVYFFYENDCKDCDKAQEWLEDYKKESFIDVEYINIAANDELYNKITKSLSIKKNKIPLIIIGSNYFTEFNNSKEEITKAIKSYEKVESYCDTVSKVRKKENIKDCLNQNKDIYNEQSKISESIKVIIIIISVCLILTASLIIQKKKILSRLHR